MVSDRPLTSAPRLLRAVRLVTIFYFACCAIVLPVGIAAGTVGAIQLATATKYPTGHKTAEFKQGNTVYFNTPELLKWRDRLLRVGVTGTAVLLSSAAAMLMLRRAAGRPGE